MKIQVTSMGGALTEAGVQHVRLTHESLDEGDLDGYTSLLADGARPQPRAGGFHDVHRADVEGSQV